MSESDLAPLTTGAPVLVTGAGITGRAVLAALAPLGVAATLTDDSPTALTALAQQGVAVMDPAAAVERISDFVLVVTSPGFAPSAPVPAAAAAAGVPIWGDVELAWRLDAAGRFGTPRRWLVVTGTNGKTTTTSMLHDMLVADGRRSLLCGNIGEPVLAVLDRPAELLAVELSSFQLHWAPSLRPEAGVVLNVAEDHLDWHGSMDAYARDKARVLDGRVAVAGLDDPVAAGLLAAAAAPVHVGFRLGEPAAGELGVRAGKLVDRAFGDGVELADTGSLGVAGPVGVLNALAAAALARAVGVAPQSIAAALTSFQVGAHRAEVVGVGDGVRYVDDSKATNPHAAQASITAYERVVWIAGGLLKGASVDELVRQVANRLAGAVLIGRDRYLVAEALSRHAPDVPVVELVTGEDSGVLETNESTESNDVHVTRVIEVGDRSVSDAVMAAAVGAARELASPGDTVLLAPAGASFDQFSGYGQRGDAFAAAVRAAIG
ncbi:UDP-N-acetylmuramoyl-L-alanine--D-glutamate ligase [Mycolicibacterium wolinskyi]|uniref:UDP-N-acetylmuramoylalanine--D-glutamate ligase n=1 Tax=Mycolicibacterium wolinskyi TaxID=59750 RepID=A0A1X2EUZ3_9MYCO|nr:MULTISPECIES: UDP-N-acetylmuramoyl-L-alanine--D-glutamate ligase [Mycolicibacterium]MCV7285769.1 UDP-N-acetylmuramoyl-L-alanine--D-glutamate ligase [Mycolicibacterium wolinskyi]MCV7297102.1 UDP-N-acetylmuramoyl-L-alanine--D-glutamate ligase [Mycolicibacterium goodii]ORX10012.1 UDP-N-acetylmuramoylalanine--D-glutamate ligase [Mycolicibacterium wolinskyi]